MKLKELVKLTTSSISPKTGEIYHLYSLPAFDEGKEEIVDGSEIQSNKYLVPNKCILFNKLNVRFKRIWRINNNQKQKICSTEFLPLIVNEKIADYQYCYYLLASDFITNYLCGQNSNTSGSHKRIDPKNFLNISVKLPELEQQKQIGKLLSSLDKKISLNRKINDNLEAMAKQLYDYYFVQFDFPNEQGKPYKSSGGAMVWNEKLKREIPAGWECGQLGDFFTVKKGSLITASETTKGNIKVVAAGVDYSYLNGESNRPANTITISASGANAGFINFWREPIFASDCTTVNGNRDIETLLVYYHLKFYQNRLLQSALGSAQPHVYPNQISELPYVKIPTELINKIETALISINSEIANNYQQSQSLTAQRDALLPLLMNGQVSVE